MLSYHLASETSGTLTAGTHKMHRLWHTLSCIRYSQKGGEEKGIIKRNVNINVQITKHKNIK